ncbi:hypothetical protein [Oceanibaculum nanhaiense]|uniref:hypothetical protein n=1 Tax=Oceanibaculum nanhaiense TaxID=1909734 RepID=UPI003D282748
MRGYPTRASASPALTQANARAGIRRRRRTHEYEETLQQKRHVNILFQLRQLRGDFTFNAVNPVPGKGKAAAGLAKGMGARKGWPDIDILYKGRLWCIEEKVKGEEPDDDQCSMHGEIEAAGGTVMVVDSDTGFWAALERIGLIDADTGLLTAADCLGADKPEGGDHA